MNTLSIACLNGLTPTQFSALVKLLEVGECSQNELGRKTAMDVATIKGVVDRLRQRDLVVVRPDPADKRRSLISLSQDVQGTAQSLYDAGFEILAIATASSELSKGMKVAKVQKISFKPSYG